MYFITLYCMLQERKRKRNEETKPPLIYASIWSSKYELKAKNHISPSKNTENFSIIARKELSVYNNSPKNKHVTSKLRSISTVQCNQFSEYQNLNENDILNVYHSSRDDKLIGDSNEKSEENLGLENTSPDLFRRRNPLIKHVTELTTSPGEDLLLENTSPELFRQKNPFVKHVTELTTSPSILSDDNCRRRGRNFMRIRRTVVDENTVVESKYFSKQNNENHDLENEEIEGNSLKNVKCNLMSKMNIDVQSSKRSSEQTEISSITSHVENVNLKEDSNKVFSNQDEYLSTTCENTFEKLHSTNDRNYNSDNTVAIANYVKADDESLNYFENINSLRDNFSHSRSSTNVCQTPPRTTEVFRERTPANSVNIEISEES